MKKKRIFSTLIRNYILFTSILVVIVVLTLIASGIALTWMMEDEEMPMITAERLVNPDYEAIDMGDLSLAGGWIEVLDQDGNLLYVKGEKQTPQRSYNLTALSEMVGFQEAEEYFYQSTSFQSVTGESLILLVAIPHGVVDYDLNLQFGVFDVSRKITKVLLLGGGTFLLLFLLNIYFYSKWTARKIQRPLDQITSVIQEMGEGNLDARMDFEGEYEFSQIKETFNTMAERLKHAEEEKSGLEASKNEMFVHISHDLKTPITTIQGFSKALADGMITDKTKARKYLNTIYQKSERMTKLIDDLFELSKLDQKNYPLSFEKRDLVEDIRAVVAEHFEQAEEREIALHFNPHAESLMVFFDGEGIQRVLANLLGNALRYNPPGTTVEISVKRENELIIIEIKDDGSGISEDVKEKIFTPFVRGDDTRNSEGSGLGLSITKKIIEHHGGTIDLITEDKTYKTVFQILMNRKKLESLGMNK